VERGLDVMMNRAYEVLYDAEYVLGLMEECDDKRLFRIYYIAGITLLRTVGQVLVSKNSTQSVRSATLKVFAEQNENKDSNKIYFNFIKKERDIVIHEYEINLECDDWEVVFPDGDDFSIFNLGELYRPLIDLSFEGQDVRDLFGEAIKWWKTQLAAIEKELESA
jgi:hypothetical protein